MSRPFHFTGCLVAVALLWRAAAASPAGEDDDRSLAAFRDHLKDRYAGKKWLEGPARLDSPALRTAYPGLRFYFVFSRPPLPPGARPTPRQEEALRRRDEEFRRSHVSVTARVDGEGRVTPLASPADYNVGLMRVAGDDDARTAAAAVLSLYGRGQVSPGVVEPAEVTVRKTDAGWTCHAGRRGAFRATVTFGADGKVSGITKDYAGPLPR